MSGRRNLSVNLDLHDREKLDEIKKQLNVMKDTDTVRYLINLVHKQITTSLPIGTDYQELFPKERVEYIEKIIQSPFISYAYGFNDISDLVRQSTSSIIEQIETAYRENILLESLITKYGKDLIIEFMIYLIVQGEGIFSRDQDSYVPFVDKEMILYVCNGVFLNNKSLNYNYGLLSKNGIDVILTKLFDNDLLELYEETLEVDFDREGTPSSIGPTDAIRLTKNGKNAYDNMKYELMDFFKK